MIQLRKGVSTRRRVVCSWRKTTSPSIYAAHESWVLLTQLIICNDYIIAADAWFSRAEFTSFVTEAPRLGSSTPYVTADVELRGYVGYGKRIRQCDVKHGFLNAACMYSLPSKMFYWCVRIEL